MKNCKMMDYSIGFHDFVKRKIINTLSLTSFKRNSDFPMIEDPLALPLRTGKGSIIDDFDFSTHEDLFFNLLFNGSMPDLRRPLTKFLRPSPL